jgi:hypothetical protein
MIGVSTPRSKTVLALYGAMLEMFQGVAGNAVCINNTVTYATIGMTLPSHILIFRSNSHYDLEDLKANTENTHVIADLIRNLENRRKTGCRIKRGMTQRNHVIADSIRNPENSAKLDAASSAA